jgi:phosphoketolase
MGMNEQIITCSESFIEIGQEINGREPILSEICIAASQMYWNGKHDFTLQNFYFGKTCAETLNFSLPKKLDLRKT